MMWLEQGGMYTEAVSGSRAAVEPRAGRGRLWDVGGPFADMLPKL